MFENKRKEEKKKTAVNTGGEEVPPLSRCIYIVWMLPLFHPWVRQVDGGSVHPRDRGEGYVT